MKAFAPIALLTVSNIFMTIAWYGHLKFPKVAMWVAILASWGIALFEYCFQVPANRIAYGTCGYDTVQLKTMQEVITLVVFTVFAVIVFKQQIRWNHLVGFGLIVLAVFFVYKKW
jgi:uncharacterized protein